MKQASKTIASVAVAIALVGCGGGEQSGKIVKAPPGSGPTTASGEAVSKAAMEGFNQAIEEFAKHERANDWNKSTCSAVAKAFIKARGEQKTNRFPEATYNAGLAYQRCGMDAQAKEQFQKALQNDPKFHYARAQLALYQFKADNNEGAVISALQQAVIDAKFQNVPALVNLAKFQMERDSSASGTGCTDDMDCAKKNLQRALAIDDSYMPAFNQLALFYFTQAKKRAGAATVKGKSGKRHITTSASKRKKGNVQQLELAALVCSQAIRKNANYAPIHNTAGLIEFELGQVNGAVSEFATAAKLDPRFFEAQMNYGAVNLSFRGFEAAAGAYKKALAMRPNDYDAHLGLALALRGLIDDNNYDKQVAAVQSEINAAKKVDGARPDAYYNEGILTQEFKAKAGGDKKATIKALNSAKGIFQTFVSKASGRDEYAAAVKRAKERMQDIDDTIQFLNM